MEKKAITSLFQEKPPPSIALLLLPVLALPDSEYLSATLRADALGGWLAVFHGYLLRILDFNLNP